MHEDECDILGMYSPFGGDIMIVILWMCGQIQIRYALLWREEIYIAFCHLSFQPHSWCLLLRI